MVTPYIQQRLAAWSEIDFEQDLPCEWLACVSRSGPQHPGPEQRVKRLFPLRNRALIGPLQLYYCLENYIHGQPQLFPFAVSDIFKVAAELGAFAVLGCTPRLDGRASEYSDRILADKMTYEYDRHSCPNPQVAHTAFVTLRILRRQARLLAPTLRLLHATV